MHINQQNNCGQHHKHVNSNPISMEAWGYTLDRGLSIYLPMYSYTWRHIIEHIQVNGILNHNRGDMLSVNSPTSMAVRTRR